MKRIALALSLLLAPSPADAFCGFYVGGADARLFNDATQVVMMRDGTRTVLSMQNAYKGPPEGFAMVVPVPVVLQKENVKTLPRELFEKVDQLTAPRLVEYWEMDPCFVEPPEEDESPKSGGGPRRLMEAPADKKKDLGVTIEAQFTVGEYEIVILSAKEAAGLETWLKENKYKIPDGAEPYLRPYVQSGSKFFVAKVDAKKVKVEDGRTMLSPLRFHYDTDTFNLPVRLGLINSGGTQDLIVNVLARGQRYESANYANATIPTNLDVAEDAKDKFGPFYAALFDRVVEQRPKTIVTEYSWDASTCDPCPGPTLSPGDLATLGADVLPNVQPMGKGRGAFMGGFVITRLHARYGKDAMGEDIVFRSAPPITGGREVHDAANAVEKGAKPGGINNFQGRYIIRHPWTGKIECKNPIRNRWGGPPNGTPPTPKPAAKIAFAPRGGIELAAFLREEVPELQLPAKGTTPTPVTPPPATTTPPATPAPTSKSGGCAGCNTGPASPFSLAALLVPALLLFRRRR